MTPQEVSTRIQDVCIKNSISQIEFSKISGLPQNVVSQLWNGKRKFLHCKTMSKVLDAIKKIERENDKN